MESRLLAIKGPLRALFANGSYRQSFMWRGVAVIHTQIPADPTRHFGIPVVSQNASGDGINTPSCHQIQFGNLPHLDEEEEVEAAEQAKESESQREYKPMNKTDPLVPPRPPATSPSSKLENTLNPPTNSTTQQKRYFTSPTRVANSEPASPNDVAACGGSPWAEEEEAKRERRRQRKEQEEDDKEYFKHHKASPLSEIEVADTRKPVSRVTDGTADSYAEGGGGDVVLFSEEQKDSAEDSLRRAVEMWRERAMRGDPDSPHGRILRELRGESW